MTRLEVGICYEDVQSAARDGRNLSSGGLESLGVANVAVDYVDVLSSLQLLGHRLLGLGLVTHQADDGVGRISREGLEEGELIALFVRVLIRLQLFPPSFHLRLGLMMLR